LLTSQLERTIDHDLWKASLHMSVCLQPTADDQLGGWGGGEIERENHCFEHQKKKRKKEKKKRKRKKEKKKRKRKKEKVKEKKKKKEERKEKKRKEKPELGI